jgi:GMP synthase (glutamine-hydrolysing)
MLRPMSGPRFTLFQARKPDDPMREHEIACFARALAVPEDRVAAVDLLAADLDRAILDATDAFLFGGSGDYSVVGEAPWLDHALEVVRTVHDCGKPTFASCWGFQVLARAMGGRVIHDASRAELGTYDLLVTEEGERDPVFGPLAPRFLAQVGHEDHVVELPPNTTLLASSELTPHQAYRFDDAPIYCTQFHPELRLADLRVRIAAYPRYLETLPGITRASLEESLAETPGSESLLTRFVELVMGAS